MWADHLRHFRNPKGCTEIAEADQQIAIGIMLYRESVRFVLFSSSVITHTETINCGRVWKAIK